MAARCARPAARSRSWFRTTPGFRKDVEEIAQAQRWSFNETLEKAIEALKRELKGKRP